MKTPRFDSGSFRDRESRVFYRDGRVLRALSQPALDDWRALTASSFYQRLESSGKIVATRELDEEPGPPWVGVLEHDRMATVWTPYDFYLNGEFHHCGTNSFSLIRDESGWRIAGVVYSIETETCEPSPLGPPEFAPTK